MSQAILLGEWLQDVYSMVTINYPSILRVKLVKPMENSEI